ncbi:hypothetical protein [Aestuariivirga litoralis]|uniref:hypothetical protein n=1 Tax=Aestuariivirga litoralis TaxID=2650924 RepID=UPI0018C854AC|nr:hypothetical protein [Aestuariivirga litoralis]MBG1230898.1 hypothetical protein [Aestuariivirga litoralis]
MADGWSVMVRVPDFQSLGKPVIYYAHLPDRDEAVSAVRVAKGLDSNVSVEAKEPITHAVLKGLNIPEGKVGHEGYELE